MSSKPPAFKQTTTQVALPEQSLKNEKRMKQVSAHACIYHGVAIICSVWVRAYLGNYKMATAKSRTLHPSPSSNFKSLPSTVFPKCSLLRLPSVAVSLSSFLLIVDLLHVLLL